MTERSLIREVFLEKMKEKEILSQLIGLLELNDIKVEDITFHELDYPSFAYDLGMDDEYIEKVHDNLPLAFETDIMTYLVFFIEREEYFDEFVSFALQAFTELELLSIKHKLAQKLVAKPFKMIPVVLFHITEEQKDKLKEAIINARSI